MVNPIKASMIIIVIMGNPSPDPECFKAWFIRKRFVAVATIRPEKLIRQTFQNLK